jgi:Zn-dependent alcohol dehydrogenase
MRAAILRRVNEPLTIDTRELDEINDAFAEMRTGVIARSVIIF